MPTVPIFIPAGATGIQLKSRGRLYNIDKDVHCFTREGEDESSLILPLFCGDEFSTPVLGAEWHKNWDSGIDANQQYSVYTENDQMVMIGEADAPPAYGAGWVVGHSVIPLMHETEITVAMESPVDTSADGTIFQFFFLIEDRDESAPSGDDNHIQIRYNITNSGLLMQIIVETMSTASTIFDGSTYDAASPRATGDLEATIWRIVIHDGDPAETGVQAARHMHIYLKQGATLDEAEEAYENELTTSPYDISYVAFDVVYPAFQITTQSPTYYDEGNEAIFGYIRVDYPDFNVVYEMDDDERFKNEVELWDGDPASGGVKVYDIDHIFSNDPFVKNGYIQYELDIGTQYGHDLWFYDIVADDWVDWNQCSTKLIDDNQLLHYAQFRYVKYLSPERVELRVRWTDDANDDDDYYVEATMRMRRGDYKIEFYDWVVYPSQEFQFHSADTGSGLARFGFNFSGDLGDADLTLTANDTGMLDNYQTAFDDEAEKAIMFNGATRQMNGSTKRFNAYQGGSLFVQYWLPSLFDSLVVFFGIVPFPLIANIFEEAEDGTTDGDIAADATASGGQKVELDAQNEYCLYQWIAGTDLPAGRYMAMVRAKDSNQIADDLGMRVYNASDTEWRNQEHKYKYETLTATWDFYSMVFDIFEEDAATTDTFQIRVYKLNADVNTIDLDYFILVPIGDNESLPEDVAHSAMREFKIEKRLFVK